MRHSVSILGAGRVGTTLAAAIARAGWALDAVVSRRLASAEAAVALAGAGRASSDPTDALRAELLIVAVPDDQLGAVARVLAPDCPAGLAACHTSGATPSTVLRPLAERGATIASAHPLQSFAEPASALASLPGACWAIEGDPEVLILLRHLIRCLEGRALEIRTEGKALYHAGAVVACNYLVALAAVATRLLGAAGIEQADRLPALLPLIRGTVDNLERVGLPDALTGPIARGDVATVRGHLAALPADLVPLYRLLGREALALARLDAASESALRELFA